jgi:cysteine synthase
MASEEFIPKNNLSPEGTYQRSIDYRVYTLTRGEAVEMISKLARMLALPGGHSVGFTVDDRGCEVRFLLEDKEKDPSLRY